MADQKQTANEIQRRARLRRAAEENRQRKERAPLNCDPRREQAEPGKRVSHTDASKRVSRGS